MIIRTLKRNIFVILLCSFLFGLNPHKGFSQNDDFKRNTFYAGFANDGALYSINYDRIFNSKKKFLLSYRIGFSILEDAVSAPLGINMITGKNSSHAEFSFTIMPYIDKYQSFLSNNDISDTYIYLIPGFGYRFQKPQGGFFFRVMASPTIFLDPPSSNFWKMDPRLKFIIGGGLGYSF